MKVYVDGELPKQCFNCKFRHKDKCCITNDWFKHETCQLQPLTDYTKQVRKEVCEKLREWARKQIIYCGGKATETDILTANASNQVLDDLKEFLDQIQGVNNANNN